MSGVFHDLRYAARVCRREWRFSVTVVLSLASGIAATAVVFNVLNNTLLRPLPFPDERRVYRLQDSTMGPDGRPLLRSNRSYNFLAIQRGARRFDAVVGLRTVERPLTGGFEPVQATVALVSPGTFELLGARPLVGRLFTPDEERVGVDARVVLLSHALWQSLFGGRTEALGSTLRLDGQLHTVVGVLGRGFRFPYNAEAWIPERVAENVEASLAVLARLAPGVTPAEAAAELEALGAALEQERPDTNRGLRFAMTPVRDQIVGDQASMTWTLVAAAVLLAGLACANVANLLLARGTTRAQVIAVQAALGASRGRQVRQLFAESLILAGAGTAAGIAAAAPLSALVMNLVPRALRDDLGLGEVAFDWRVAVFAALATTATAVIAGLAPARRLAGTRATEALRQHSRSTTGPHGLMQGLVIGEVALAAMLLLSSGLLLDNLERLLAADLGLRPENLTSVRLSLPPSRYEAAETRIAIARHVLEAARSIHGVERAGHVSTNPLERGSVGTAIETADRPLAPREAGLIINHRLVSADWFATAGVTLLGGRLFEASDDERGAPVAIVSRRLADRLWPSGERIGRRLRQVRPNAPWITVVGVVGDVLDSGDWRETWYLPYAQHASTLSGATLHLMLRSPLEASALAADLRAAVAAVDPALPVPLLSPMAAIRDVTLEPQRLAASASALFAVSGLLLAAIGTYGLLAYAVSARAREFGIRLALGAPRVALLASVMRRGVALSAAGLAVGIGAGLAINTVLLAVAIESPGTPSRIVGVAIAALGASALAASFLPAWRATRMNPTDVMRVP